MSVTVRQLYSHCNIWWLSVSSRQGQRASKCACLVVPPLFRADSRTNLIKQGENVKGRPCGSVAQLAECSHGKREALGSSPGRATIFSFPVTLGRLNIRKSALVSSVSDIQPSPVYKSHILNGPIYKLYLSYDVAVIQ